MLNNNELGDITNIHNNHIPLYTLSLFNDYIFFADSLIRYQTNGLINVQYQISQLNQYKPLSLIYFIEKYTIPSINYLNQYNFKFIIKKQASIGINELLDTYDKKALDLLANGNNNNQQNLQDILFQTQTSENKEVQYITSSSKKNNNDNTHRAIFNRLILLNIIDTNKMINIEQYKLSLNKISDIYIQNFISCILNATEYAHYVTNNFNYQHNLYQSLEHLNHIPYVIIYDYHYAQYYYDPDLHLYFNLKENLVDTIDSYEFQQFNYYDILDSFIQKYFNQQLMISSIYQWYHPYKYYYLLKLYLKDYTIQFTIVHLIAIIIAIIMIIIKSIKSKKKI